jgi:GDP/UDP-N,N'-diacetylbacillosamine 2-epimerase (hydrolysing)
VIFIEDCALRKIFLITERRADYSRFQPILKLIEQAEDLEYDLVVTGLHLKKEHGETINEIVSDGFRIFDTFEMFKEDVDSSGAMVRAYAEAVRCVTFALERSKPDLILSGFDIAANAAVTLAGAHMNIPVAHIQGGEVTGTIDESIRHAMSKFAHYHFAANEDACERLIKLGERPDCVFNVGCPSIDAICAVPDDPSVMKRFRLHDEFVILIQHPVTSEYNDAEWQMQQTLEALAQINADVLVILPNNDAGYSKIVNSVKASRLKTIDTLSINDYVNLLKRCIALVGNSSSGIHEAATFNIPVINIGTRQQGRLRPDNVIDVNYDASEILEAFSRALNMKVSKRQFTNPYGDGQSAIKILNLLRTLDLGSHVIQKRITY